MRYLLLKRASLSLSLDTRAVVLFLRLRAPLVAGEQNDISPLPSFSLFSLDFFMAGHKDEMWGLFLQHHCGALFTRPTPPPGKCQGWDKRWVCLPPLFRFATSDTCLKPCVKAETCGESQLYIIHLCPGLSPHLIKPQLASGSDMPWLFFPTPPSQFHRHASPCTLQFEPETSAKM